MICFTNEPVVQCDALFQLKNNLVDDGDKQIVVNNF